MSVKTKKEILDSLKIFANNENSDEFIALLEDVNDTISEYENNSNENVNWKNKYEENDANWRQKYTERFFENVPQNDLPNDIEKRKPLSFEDLFKEG